MDSPPEEINAKVEENSDVQSNGSCDKEAVMTSVPEELPESGEINAEKTEAMSIENPESSGNDESNASHKDDLASETSQSTNAEKCETMKPDAQSGDESKNVPEQFKMPLTLGSKGKHSRATPSESSKTACESSEGIKLEEKKPPSNYCSSTKPRDNSIPIPYKEPPWSCLLEETYSLEVLKSGIIIETIDLSSKPFYVFGRQSNCDVQLGHPTVSRHHAVLQHRAKSEEAKEDEKSSCKSAGLYIFDIGSTHGTFVNKQLIPKQRYIRLHVGHVIKFGGSTRSYIVLGPESDSESESEKSVTELKEEAMKKKIGKIEGGLMTGVDKMEDEEDQGVDWGLGEDADEESDLSENPFAATQNEELYLDDPKKTLRGWFEREGEELEYEVEEKSFGQFLCHVRLPVDDARGKPMVAEALVKGKKKEAVVQCALEACRILDRLGLLRQANHESKKRKARNWEEDDFYESDEDTFLDRTGTVERKREKRMRSAGKLKATVETYETLLEKREEVLKKLQTTREALDAERSGKTQTSKGKANEEEEGDTLDAYMSTLSEKASMDKVNVRRLKMDLAELQQEEVHINKLIEIARPISLPGIDNSTSSSIKSQDLKKVEVESKAQPEDAQSTSSNKNPVSLSKETAKDDPKNLSEKQEEFPESVNIKEKPLKNVDIKNDNATEDAVEKISTPTDGKACKSAPLRDSETLEENDEAEPPKKSVKSESKKKMAKAMAMNLEEDYSMWVPPENQTGDGKTKLNEKYGY